MAENFAPGELMRRESAEAASVLLKGLTPNEHLWHLQDEKCPDAIYTIARGSSDAAATILNYEIMKQLQIASTTLPPSIFSLRNGVILSGAMTITISQSGASDDLVSATKGASLRGASTVAITNVDGSPVEQASDIRVPIEAGPELAIPATKSVVGAVAAGASLISVFNREFKDQLDRFTALVKPEDLSANQFDDQICHDLIEAKRVYIVGREGLLGAAQEIALKLKECCAIHAEAYSASEVLHGPMQLAKNGLLTILLDDGSLQQQKGLDHCEKQLTQAGSFIKRLRLKMPATAPQAINSAVFLIQLYPIILKTSLMLGLNPDAPDTLKKVTQTI